MRVALVAPGYAPDLGGVEVHVTQLAQGLARLGVDVEVWAQQTGRRRAVVEAQEGVTVRRFRTSSSRRFPISPELWRHVRTAASGVDVMHAHSLHVSAALSTLVADRRIPLVVTPHWHGGGHSAAARLLHLGYLPQARRLLRRATAVITVSAAEQALLLRDVPAVAGRCRTIHNGADVQALAAAQPYATTEPVILVAGRLERYKRVDLAVEVFRSPSAPGRLVILGDGPDRERLTALASKSGGRIAFLGHVPDAEVHRWLRTANAVLSLSEHEAFGLVALEAAAAGARVVLSDIPAHREVAGLLPAEAVRLVAPSVALVRAALEAAVASGRVAPRPVRSWTQVAHDHLALYRTLAA